VPSTGTSRSFIRVHRRPIAARLLRISPTDPQRAAPLPARQNGKKAAGLSRFVNFSVARALLANDWLSVDDYPATAPV